MNKGSMKKRLVAVVMAICVMFSGSSVLTALAAGETTGVASAGTQGGYLVHEESFSGDRELTGLIASALEYFQTGADWDIESVTLTLVLAASPLVRQEVSDFTISLNDRPVYSERIPLTKGEIYQTVIDLPLDAITGGVNSLLIESYIRTNETEPCADDVSKASWLTALRHSYVSVKYKSTAKIQSVADLYTQFTSIEALENDASAVLIPGSPVDSELTAAGYILSGMSNNAVMFYDSVGMQFVNGDSDISQKKYGIYVTMLGSMMSSVKQQLSGEQIDAANNGGLIALVKVGGSDILVVTANEAQDLVKTGQLFGHKKYMEQTWASWRKVFREETVTFKTEEEGVVRKLSEVGAYLYGPFRQEHTFFITSYSNRILEAGSKVDLFFRYAENLDFDRSLITVYLDNVPIGSKKLSKEMAAGDQVSFVLPTNIEVSGPFAIRVAFDLEIKDLECTLRQNEMPWGYVTPESTIEMHSKDSPYLVFDYYPGPFVAEGHLNDVCVVMPSNMGEYDLEAMRGIMLLIGRFLSDNSGALRVCTEATIGNVAKENMIVIGRYANNTIARDINNQLYFQFSPNGTTIRPNEKTMIEPNYGAILGTAQLIYSPYSAEKKAMLLVSGVTDEGMMEAAKYLSSMDTLWRLVGDGFIADTENAFFYRFKAENAMAPTSAWSRLTATPQVLYATIAVIAVVLLLVGTVIVIALRYGKKGKHAA